mmetsp:Transcript_84642/g.236925  ORF Transcript_84642/g.236925 Transcript_84642/m.236925 type:complete len:494 (-) Transcript_84642:2-1483(-)
MHLRRVVPRGDVVDGDAAAPLGEQPSDVLLGAPALLLGAGDEGDVPDVLQDRARRALQLFPRGALLTEGVAELVVLEDHAVGVKAFLGARLLADAAREGPRALRLHGAHDLELGATARALRPADDELLRAAALGPAVHEEHQDAPILFDAAQRRAPRACDVADAVRGHLDHGAVVALLPAVHVHRSLELLEQPLHVLPGLLPLGAGAREERVVAHVLHDGAGGALELLPGAALLPEGVGELVVLEGHGVRAPSARLVAAAVPVHDLVLDLAVVPGHLRLHRAEDLELGAPAAAHAAENGELLVVPIPAARAHLAEEHQRGPLLLDGAEEVAGPAGHESDGLLRHLEHRQVVVVEVGVDHDGARALRHDSLGVLLRPAPLHLGTAELEDEVALEELDLGLGHARDLLLRLPTLPEDEGRVVVGDLHRVDAVVVGLLLAAAIPGARAAAVLPAAAATAAAVSAVVAPHDSGCASARLPKPGKGVGEKIWSWAKMA